MLAGQTLFSAAPLIPTSHPAVLPMLQAALDVIPISVMIADRTGRIVHLNSPAAAMLRDRDPLTYRHSRLRAASGGASEELATAIAAATCGTPNPIAGVLAVALPCREGGLAIAQVRALQLAEGDGQRAVAAILVTPPSRDAPHLPVLSRYFKLTPTEARVLAAVSSGKNRNEVALALDVAQSTVKTHLQNLYAKTGIRDRAGLCRLVTQCVWSEETP